MKTKHIILFLFIITLVIRAGVSLYYSTNKNANYWEYGFLAKNLVAGNGYSLFLDGNFYIPAQKDNNSKINKIKPLPSAYMMPGYPVFLAALFLIFGNEPDLAVYLVQALLSALIAILLYKLTLHIAGEKAALIASLIYIFLPEMIYTTVSIGPTVFVHFFVISVLYLLTKNHNKQLSTKNIILIGFLLALSLYIRPALAMFAFIIIIFFFYKRYFKQGIIISVILLAALSPWIARNYMTWHKFIPFTTTTGLNTYRGHNPYYPGFWQTKEIEQKIRKLPNSNDYELKIRDIFMDYAVKEIKEHPIKEIFFSFKKFLHLWLYYPYDSRTHNLIYLIPWLLILAFSIFSLISAFDFNQKKYIYFYLLSTSLNAMLFFALLRYQTLMKIALLPLAAHGIITLWNFTKKKFKTVS